MPLNLPDYPTFNGKRHDWSSIKFDIQGARMRGLKDLSYKHSLEPGELRGTAAQVLGRTLGTYSAEASFTCALAEYQALITEMGTGYLEQEFNITAKYAVAKGDPINTVEILGCRIKSADNSHSQSNEPLMVKVELSVMLIRENGINPMLETLGV